MEGRGRFDHPGYKMEGVSLILSRPSIVPRIMLQTTFFLLALAVGVFAVTPAIPDGVQKISAQVTKLDNAVTAFSSTNTYMDAFVRLSSTPSKNTSLHPLCRRLSIRTFLAWSTASKKRRNS
jgi:hypothetical protein